MLQEMKNARGGGGVLRPKKKGKIAQKQHIKN